VHDHAEGGDHSRPRNIHFRPILNPRHSPQVSSKFLGECRVCRPGVRRPQHIGTARVSTGEGVWSKPGLASYIFPVLTVTASNCVSVGNTIQTGSGVLWSRFALVAPSVSRFQLHTKASRLFVLLASAVQCWWRSMAGWVPLNGLLSNCLVSIRSLLAYPAVIEAGYGFGRPPAMFSTKSTIDRRVLPSFNRS
jgi:hypothetical protein